MTNDEDIFSAFPAEREILSGLVRDGNAADWSWVIEIGCLRGRTSAVLALECAAAGRKLLCIDPWDGRTDGSGADNFEAFTRATKRYADRGVVAVVRASSQEADVPDGVWGNVGLVLIDGDHRPPAPLLDMLTYWPALAPGGCLAVHDTFDAGWGPGVMAAVDEFAARAAPVTVVHHVYYPTADEVARHGHGRSGLAVIRKGS